MPGLYSLLAFVLARRVVVSGWSMTPGLLPGDRLLFDRLAYVRDPPRIGDIVLASHPDGSGLRVVKRIAERPGGIAVSKGQHWLIGDSPDVSIDSREFGPVNRNALLGKAWVLYWPTGRWRVLSGATDSLSHRR